MGVESDYIIAARADAKKINKAMGGHWKRWPTLFGKGIDHVVLTTLWGLLNETKEFDQQFFKSIKVLHQESPEGAWVYLVPKRFSDKLLAVPEKDLKKLANALLKAAELNKYGGSWTKDFMWDFFQQFVAFFRKAKTVKKDVLLWMSL